MKQISNSTYEQLLFKPNLSQKDRILLLLSYNNFSPKSVKDLKSIGLNLGLTEIVRWNVSQILSNYNNLVISIDRKWNITSEGKQHIISLIDSKTNPKEHIIESGFDDDLIDQITNKDIRLFTEQAVGCYKEGFYRASVVLAWEGAIFVLYDYVIKNSLIAFNNEATRRFQNRRERWKSAINADDLTNMKESEFLEILVTISIIGKSVKKELLHKLDLRNSCGHPNSLTISKLTVASYLEFLVENIFQKF